MLNHPNQKSEKEGGIVSIHRVRERQGSECEWERERERLRNGGREVERKRGRQREGERGRSFRWGQASEKISRKGGQAINRFVTSYQ